MEGDLVRGVASICINYAEMRNTHKKKEILPSNIGRRKTTIAGFFNSWRAMMRGAT